MKDNLKNVLMKVLKYVIVGVVVFLVATVIMTYINDKTLSFNLKYALSGQPFIFVFLALGALLVYDLLRTLDGKGGKKKKEKAIDKVTDTHGNETSQFFNRDFVTEEELKTNKGFNYNTLSTIKNSKKDGILVRAEESKGKMEINFVEPIHTLVVGTTSSGKTSRFVVPSLQLMSMTASKPSFVITDPKGELYDKDAVHFMNQGYDVKVLDLRDPFSSTQWNPLTYPFDTYTRSFSLENEVRVHPPGDNPKQYNLIIQRDFDYSSSTWFEFDKKAYVDKSMLENDMRVMSRKLRDDTFNALNDICTTLAPIESDKDPSWERTAQRLIHAVMLAMLEDSRIPELGMTRDKYNLYNVQKICNMTDSGRDTYASIKKYLFDYRDKFSQVHDLASTALNNAEGTTKNYMGFVSSKTALFSDAGISFLTEKTEIDFVDMDEKPTAIFLIIPDEIRVRYPLAILFVTQLYKRLVEKAQSLSGARLKRNVYFMLDEFGNMPKFPQFGSIMTVGRSRGIFFELAVQSYSQLYQVYGQDEGKIIKDNCPIQVYIASEDMTTNKEFSELLGKRTIRKGSENKSVGPDGKETKSYSEVVESVPLVYPEQLMTYRDKGEIIIKTFTPNACLKTKISSCYGSKVYNISQKGDTYRPRRMFDENEVFYDARKRNQFMAKQNDDDDDDDDLF